MEGLVSFGTIIPAIYRSFTVMEDNEFLTEFLYLVSYMHWMCAFISQSTFYVRRKMFNLYTQCSVHLHTYERIRRGCTRQIMYKFQRVAFQGVPGVWTFPWVLYRRTEMSIVFFNNNNLWRGNQLYYDWWCIFIEQRPMLIHIIIRQTSVNSSYLNT